MQVEKPSDPLLDIWRRSARCCRRGSCRRCPPPSPNDHLTVHLVFQYHADDHMQPSHFSSRPASWLSRRSRCRPAAAGATADHQQPHEVTVHDQSATAAFRPSSRSPDFLALSTDAETRAARRRSAEVLWDDLKFEREFYMIPRRTLRDDSRRAVHRRGAARSLARARRRRRGRSGPSEDRPPASRPGAARRCGVRPTVVREGVQRRRLRTRGCTRTRSPTRFTSSSAALRGVARTKLTFSSDRDGERMKGTGRGPRDQRGLHRRLRRRESAAHHGDARR